PVTVRIQQQRSVVAKSVSRGLSGNPGSQAHPCHHGQEPDNGQRRNSGNSKEEKLRAVDAQRPWFKCQNVIGRLHRPFLSRRPSCQAAYCFSNLANSSLSLNPPPLR